MKKLINRLRMAVLSSASLLAMLTTSGIAMVSAPAFAAPTPVDNKSAICEGIGLSGSGCTATGGPSVNSTIKLAIAILSFIVGIAAVIMIIIGGFKYITSGGDSNSISSAKNTIIYAIIGLVIAVLAQIIVRFVLNQAAPAAGTP